MNPEAIAKLISAAGFAPTRKEALERFRKFRSMVPDEVFRALIAITDKPNRRKV